MLNRLCIGAFFKDSSAFVFWDWLHVSMHLWIFSRVFLFYLTRIVSVALIRFCALSEVAAVEIS